MCSELLGTRVVLSWCCVHFSGKAPNQICPLVPNFFTIPIRFTDRTQRELLLGGKPHPSLFPRGASLKCLFTWESTRHH